MNHSPLICISGGIGSGKSVVCRILRHLGHEVFDCDREARFIMDCSPSIRLRIAEEIDPKAVCDDVIDRRILAKTVFGNHELLQRLNSIVHTAVTDELCRRHKEFSKTNPGIPFFAETAILYQSGLNKVADMVWEVEAPMSLRIDRVMLRNGLSREDVEARIASQTFEPDASAVIPPTAHIINDNTTPVLPQVLALLHKIRF